MPQARSLLLIEDDADDIAIFQAALNELDVHAELHVFRSAGAAYDYLDGLTDTSETPGLIFCDLHLCQESGLDLRARLESSERLHNLTIPFVFMATAVDETSIKKAFQLTVQGIFLKESSMERCVEQLRTLLQYWSLSVTPNSPRPPAGWL